MAVSASLSVYRLILNLFLLIYPNSKTPTDESTTYAKINLAKYRAIRSCFSMPSFIFSKYIKISSKKALQLTGEWYLKIFFIVLFKY